MDSTEILKAQLYVSLRGKINTIGLILLELCTELNVFFISSIQFKHTGDHVTTWMYPRSHQWHLIDYAIFRKRITMLLEYPYF